MTRRIRRRHVVNRKLTALQRANTPRRLTLTVKRRHRHQMIHELPKEIKISEKRTMFFELVKRNRYNRRIDKICSFRNECHLVRQ